MYAVTVAIQVNMQVYAGAGTVITQIIIYVMSGDVDLLHRLTLCSGWNRVYYTD